MNDLNSQSFAKFCKTLTRAGEMAVLRRSLIAHGVSFGGSDNDNYYDLGRASVVLAVAAMDSYFTDAFIEFLESFLIRFQPTDELVSILARNGMGVKEALGLIYEKEPRKKIKDRIEKQLEKYVTQDIENIDRLFLSYSLRNLSQSAVKMSGNMETLSSLKLLVNRRHGIVHDGDYENNGDLNPYDDELITQQVQSMEEFVMCCDKILMNKFNSPSLG